MFYPQPARNRLVAALRDEQVFGLTFKIEIKFACQNTAEAILRVIERPKTSFGSFIEIYSLI